MKRLLLLIVVASIIGLLLILLWRRVSGQGDVTGDAPSTAARPMNWLLFVLPLPAGAAALIALVRGQTGLLLGDALGYGLLLGGAVLAQRGIGAGGRLLGFPALGRWWPFKTLGAGVIALGSGVTAWLGVGHHLAIGAAFALVTLLGFHLAYGLDLPLRRGLLGIGAHGLDSLRRAERSIAAIEQAQQDIRQPELDARLTRIVALARQILQRVQDNPRDLRRARKFLNVYLVPEREVDFVFSGNVLDSDPMVEVGDLAEAAAAEAGNTIPLTD